MTLEEFNALEKGDRLYKIACWEDGIVRTEHVVCFNGKRREDGSIEVQVADWRNPIRMYLAELLEDWHTSQRLEAAMIELAEKVLAQEIQKRRNRIAASTLKLNDLLSKKPSDIIDLPEIHQKKIQK